MEKCGDCASINRCLLAKFLTKYCSCSCYWPPKAGEPSPGYWEYLDKIAKEKKDALVHHVERKGWFDRMKKSISNDSALIEEIRSKQTKK